MECKFIGVGDAFDGKHTNTSLYVKIKNRTLLFDCGFNSAHSFFQLVPNSLDLDIVWISHFHGDHCFGLPMLLGSFHTSDRKDPLTICGPVGIEEKVRALTTLAFPRLLSKLSFELKFQECSPESTQDVAGVKLSSFQTDHTELAGPALAVRVDYEGFSFFYSGDGAVSSQCLSLASGVDLAVFEAYYLEETENGHSSVKGCLDFALKAKINQVALVHINHFVRTYHLDEILKLIKDVEAVSVLLPEEGHLLRIPGN
ncbi:Ribonuclease BN, tRNA processing enzyme [Maridesulfovibrio ferrireducens]|uniref:Ribonuclease BN, tRNA processing enzyme n=1 Tax=Maridesulfovibrio ferrireducens TaxID=246191 RepID=A0A1G9D6I6_9BACT|nr:MBL fold metallo-hydrolase [Maridesulfovibrio ferrireducens]SDK59443.1 Ribonuclease BN, tRNA processing enzyme [Maridesulfovibrio ferrireducens]